MNSRSNRPNILLITADQLRWDCLGCFGNQVIKTPNIDSLAGNGVRFTNAYTTAPLCVPARQSILTGMYPSAHGAIRNRSAVPEGTPTIASLLRKSGYQTAAFGKMHFWPVYADYGFDLMELAEQDGPGWQVDDYHSKFLKSQGLVDQWDLWDQQKEYRKNAPPEYWETFGAKKSELPLEKYHTTWIGDRTVNYLNTVKEPFFAWTSFIKPHHPFDPPEPYDKMYDPDQIPLPPRGDSWQAKPLLTKDGDPRQAYFDTRNMSEAQLRRVAAMYYGLISQIDDQVGRIIQALQDRGFWENTVIIFATDHGDYLGQYGLFLKHPNVPYDALVKTPLIISGAGVKQRGVCRDLVSLIDLLPTATEWAAADNPSFYQGKSLVPLLTERRYEWKRPAVFMETGSIKAVRTEKYKYIYSPCGRVEELYDLQSDPYEMTNIANEMPGVVAEHRQVLLDWMIESAWDRYSHGEWRAENQSGR